jgi:hypothetical protein
VGLAGEGGFDHLEAVESPVPQQQHPFSHTAQKPHPGRALVEVVGPHPGLHHGVGRAFAYGDQPNLRPGAFAPRGAALAEGPYVFGRGGHVHECGTEGMDFVAGTGHLRVGLIGAPVLGGLVASRRPENPYGWLWLGLSLGLALLSFGQVYAAYSVVVEPGSLPAPRTVGHVVAGEGWVAAFTMVPLLLLLFPTGRLPSRRWRFVAWAVAVC